MLIWAIQITIVSIILIFLVHHLIIFFKSTLTVPKLKDLVNTPAQKYESIYNIINHQNNNLRDSSTENNYTLIDLLPNKDNKDNNDNNMKSELKNFLKSQLHTNTNIDTISSLESSMNSYSNY